ncbi:hypothetical protein WKW77_04750 [Variovorax ureilyticus]|uniref:Membrane-anchored ribosome-binding protein, inhibits growth in stationary phase, ElaB/YqjD/DUF883 family n=1 Tax=Variovorax ureilyticus TaxID=1836198 RepID=A0ABU8VBF3_9BURK
MQSQSSNLPGRTADDPQDTSGSDATRSTPHEPGEDNPTGASMRRALDDADEIGRRTADAAQGYFQEAKGKASAAAQAGKAYAENAVNAAGKKIDDMKDQAAALQQRSMQFVADEPLKAVACAAAAGGVLTALLMSWSRARR